MSPNNQFRESGLITPHTRSLIYRAIGATGEWRGERRGVTMRIQLLNQPELFRGSRVHWRARFQNVWISSFADTIRDAIDDIEDRAKK
jgi:hypothetical protein